MIYLINDLIYKYDFNDYKISENVHKNEETKVLIHFPIEENKIIYINKLYSKSEKFLYPDILFKHKFEEEEFIVSEEIIDLAIYLSKKIYTHNIFIFKTSVDRIEEILNFISNTSKSQEKTHLLFDNEEKEIINKITNNLNLSITVEHEFYSLAKKLKVREKNILVLEKYICSMGKNKKENMKIYEEIKRKILP